MKIQKDAALLVCEVLGVGAGLLVLPCAIADLAFGSDLLGGLIEAMLIGVACAAILAVLGVREGWFDAYLSRSDDRTAGPSTSRKQDPSL